MFVVLSNENGFGTRRLAAKILVRDDNHCHTIPD